MVNFPLPLALGFEVGRVTILFGTQYSDSSSGCIVAGRFPNVVFTFDVATSHNILRLGMPPVTMTGSGTHTSQVWGFLVYFGASLSLMSGEPSEAQVPVLDPLKRQNALEVLWAFGTNLP